MPQSTRIVSGEKDPVKISAAINQLAEKIDSNNITAASSPTWTGNHTFSPTTGTAITITNNSIDRNINSQWTSQNGWTWPGLVQAHLIEANHSATSGTGLSFLTNISALSTVFEFGAGGVAAIGTPLGLATGVVIGGSGDNSNEAATYFGSILYQIGTGYTQTGAPVGKLWFADYNIHGPIGVQSTGWNGISLFANNYFNGSPATGVGASLAITTKKAGGGGGDATHLAANTFPIGTALLIAGDSNAGSPAAGFTAGITLGASGSAGPWSENASIMGTGIKFGGTFTSAGIDMTGATISGANAIQTPSFAITAGGAAIIGATSSSISARLVAHIGTNRNFFCDTATILANGIAFGSINDANSAFESMELKATTLYLAGTTLQTSASLFTANGTVSTVLTNLGPAAAHTTVQEWFTVTNSAGTVRYIPAF